MANHMEGLRLGWSATFFWKTEKQVSMHQEEASLAAYSSLHFIEAQKVLGQKGPLEVI